MRLSQRLHRHFVVAWAAFSASNACSSTIFCASRISTPSSLFYPMLLLARACHNVVRNNTVPLLMHRIFSSMIIDLRTNVGQCSYAPRRTRFSPTVSMYHHSAALLFCSLRSSMWCHLSKHCYHPWKKRPK